MTLIAYLLQQDESGPIGAQLEWLEAKREGKSLYRLVESPVFAYGFCRGDLVEVEKSRGAQWIVGIVEQSQNWCARVVANESNGHLEEDIYRQILEFGLNVRRTDFPMMVVDVDGEQDARAVMNYLEHGQSSGLWFFDLAVDPFGKLN